jgi:hypothetical protein
MLKIILKLNFSSMFSEILLIQVRSMRLQLRCNKMPENWLSHIQREARNGIIKISSSLAILQWENLPFSYYLFVNMMHLDSYPMTQEALLVWLSTSDYHPHPMCHQVTVILQLPLLFCYCLSHPHTSETES